MRVILYNDPIAPFMEANAFLFGTGVALFIALLAWGDLIRKPRENLLELENKYINQLGEKKASILPLLRPYTKYGFTKQMGSIIKLSRSGKIKDIEVELMDKIQSLHDYGYHIEKFYNFRYFSVMLFTLTSLFLGIMSSFIGFNKINILNWTYNDIFVGIVLVFIGVISVSMIICYFYEKKFAEELNSASDEIEE